jgi:Cof subfamily protein (haloacid dehalogenase superfamily)
MYYIIFDMDDTLLNDRREITPFTLDVLKKAQAMGHKLVCNTARSKAFNQKYFDQIRPDYAILNGGSLIIDGDENVVFSAEVDVPTLHRVLDDLLQITDDLFVQTQEQFYSHKGKHTIQAAVPFDFSAEKFPYPAQKIVTDVKDDDLAQALADKYHLAFTTYMGGTFRRYNHINATKALGNRNLMKLVGGDVKDIIAFGDDYGDMGMLQEAGVGVIMKNGRPELLGKTSHISEYTNDEDGVARFLMSYLEMK